MVVSKTHSFQWGDTMQRSAKEIYEKMIDYKRFATILLACGGFLYLGGILPTDHTVNVSAMTFASFSLLVVSIAFFIISRKYRAMLSEMEDGWDYLMKK